MVSGLHSGLAATLGDVTCCHSNELANAGHLHERSVFELIELLYSSNPLEISVGMAALNSLLKYDENEVIECNARDLLAEKSKNKTVTIIGHFPFLDLLREKADLLHVLELSPGPGELDASEYVNVLPVSNVIGLTATTLMNGTFDDLHRYFPKDAFVVMMGPSTPMTPFLFDFGIHVLAGSKVTDAATLSHFITQGTTLHGAEGLKRISITRNFDD
jgi:uncharacterized protein (DUF4213/DUF364 family)